MTHGARLGDIVVALHLQPVNERQDRQEIAHRIGRQRANIQTAPSNGRQRPSKRTRRRGQDQGLQHGDRQRAGDHKGGVQTLIAATMRGALFDRRLGLGGGEARHDQQAAGDRDAREIERPCASGRVAENRRRGAARPPAASNGSARASSAEKNASASVARARAAVRCGRCRRRSRAPSRAPPKSRKRREKC